MSGNIKKLANIINDYEKFPSHVYLNDGSVDFDALCHHIDRWLSQFDDNDRTFVLQHTVNLMSKNYYGKQRYIESINAISSNKRNQKIFKNGYLLEIQENGDSQSNINSLLKDSLYNKYNINIPTYTTNSNLNQNSDLIYLDDFSFSGNRIQQDIKKLLDDEQEKLKERRIFISIFLVHSYSQHILPNELNKLTDKKNIQPLFHFSNTKNHPFGWASINNSFKYYTELSEIYFPEKNIITEIPTQFRDVKLYIPEYFRSGNQKNCLLGNDIDRRRIEKIFTEKGFYILSHSNDPSPVIKPLGYSGFNGFGFGGNVFSYRNCPNNTPLIFWWGNYEENDNTALGCWYPLMARTTY